MENGTDVQSEDEFSSFRLDVRWWIVFEGDEHPAFVRWWHAFTHNMFRHCWAFTEFKDGWLSISSGPGGTRINYTDRADLMGKGYRDMVHFVLKEGKVVVPCFGTITNGYIPRFFPFTCVSLIKHLLGSRSRAITPYQLYRYLVKRHMDVVEYGKVQSLLEEIS